MLDLISIEIKKFRRSKMLWAVVISSIISAWYAIVVRQMGSIRGYMENGMMTANVITGIILFSIYTSSVFNLEYRQDTINTIFSVPVSRIKILISKFILIFLVIIATIFLMEVSIILFIYLGFAGNTVHRGVSIGEHFNEYVVNCLLCSLMQFMLIPIMSFVSIWRKSNILCIILASFITIENLVLFTRPRVILYYIPWNSPGVIFWSFHGRNFPRGIPGTTSSAIALVVAFILGSVATIAYALKSDVTSNK